MPIGFINIISDLTGNPFCWVMGRGDTAWNRVKCDQKVRLCNQWVQTALLWSLLWKKRDWAGGPGGWKNRWSFFFFFKIEETYWKLEQNIWGHLFTLHPALRLPGTLVKQDWSMANTDSPNSQSLCPHATSLLRERNFPLVFPYPSLPFPLPNLIRKSN